MTGGGLLFDVWSLATGNIDTYYTGPSEVVSYHASEFLTHSVEPNRYDTHNFVTGVTGGSIDSSFSPGITPNAPSLTCSGAVLWSASQGGHTWWTTAADSYS